MRLNEEQESIVNTLLDSLVAYINEFDKSEVKNQMTESGAVTPHLAKELHDNIKRALKISGKDYGSDICCFSTRLRNLNFSERLRECFSQNEHLYYLGVKEYKNQDKLFDLIGPFNTYKEYEEASNKLPDGMYGLTMIVAKNPVDRIPDNIKKILAKNNVHCWSDFVKLSNEDQHRLRRECGHGSDLFNQFDHMLEDTGNKITW